MASRRTSRRWPFSFALPLLSQPFRLLQDGEMLLVLRQWLRVSRLEIAWDQCWMEPGSGSPVPHECCIGPGHQIPRADGHIPGHSPPDRPGPRAHLGRYTSAFFLLSSVSWTTAVHIASFIAYPF